MLDPLSARGSPEAQSSRQAVELLLSWYNQTKEDSAAMDLYALKRGDRVRTTDGAVAEVVNDTEDGQWILVRYIESARHAELVGTEDLCHEDELEALVQPNSAMK